MNFTYNFADGAGRNNGNVQGMNDTVQNLNYGFQYDELNRLARAETTNTNLWGNTYGYDIWGNLYAKYQIAGTQQGEFFQQTMNTKNQFVGWSYDAAGNLLNDGAHSYQYDPEGRIRCLDAGANCANPAASYVYSVEGRRVKRTAGGATTLYLHDGGSVLSEFSNPSPGVGTWLKDYIYLNGQLLATESVTDGTRYHFSDHLGTPRVIADAGGNVLSRHDYYPYGKEITAWTDGETHKFTGKERDTESGLDYFGARFYASSAARFASVDPVALSPQKMIDPQQFNMYSYARGNPLRFIDPDGEEVRLADLGEDEREWLIAELEGASGLDLEYDEETGTLSIVGEGTAGSETLREGLRRAIDSKDVINVLDRALDDNGDAVAFGAIEGKWRTDETGKRTKNLLLDFADFRRDHHGFYLDTIFYHEGIAHGLDGRKDNVGFFGRLRGGKSALDMERQVARESGKPERLDYGGTIREGKLVVRVRAVQGQRWENGQDEKLVDVTQAHLNGLKRK
jgi:RHS repeat-associated protein